MSSIDIYSIYKSTCTVNGKVYIGYTSNYTSRVYSHKNDCFKKHKNTSFYSAIRKYGWDNFTWEIIYQSYDRTHTLEVMEPFFIREYNSYVHFENSNGYNMTFGGECSNNCSTISILKLSIARRKTRYFISPQGETIKVDDLKVFCEENNLGFYAMADIWLDRQISHKGWTKLNSIYTNYVANIGNSYKLVSPEYEIFDIKNLHWFCQTHGLNYSCMCKVVNNQSKYHRGWCLYDVNIDYSSLQNAIYILYDKNGIQHTFKNIEYFCKLNNLRSSLITKVLDGTMSYHKGWRLTQIQHKNKIIPKKYKLIHEDGTIIFSSNLIKFLKTHNMHSRMAKKLLSGVSHKGWSVELV